MRASSDCRPRAAILVCSQVHLLFKESLMRPAIAASALCLGLLLLAALPAAPETPASPAAAPPSAAQVANDDAAKHAKRTACLKDAKARKLVGADKSAFIKNCMDAPADAISASRIEKP
jgi:hypothetical protein